VEEPVDLDELPDWAPAVVAAEAAEAAATGADVAPPQPVAVDIDLVATGFTEAVDTPVEIQPATVRWSPVVIARDEPLTIVHTGDRRRGLRTAIVASLLAVALVAALLVLSMATGSGGTP
jgi:hypothetical protein